MANIIPISSHKNANSMGWRKFIIIMSAASLAMFAAIFILTSPPRSIASISAASHDGDRAQFSICNGPRRYNCVVDGDTFWYAGRKIRIADINTPELGDAQCPAERQLGQRARNRLLILLNDGAFSQQNIARDQDKYGRDLRVITRGGNSLDGILIDEGLAEPWRGYKGYWC